MPIPLSFTVSAAFFSSFPATETSTVPPDALYLIALFSNIAGHDQALVFGRRPEELAGLPDEARQINPLTYGTVHAGLRFRDYQHGVDHIQEAVAILDSACRHAFILGY